MAYLIIPAGTDQIKNSQGQIRENFIQLNNVLTNVNVPALRLTNTVAPGTAANQVALFDITGPTSTANELAFQRSGNGRTTIFTEGTQTPTDGYTRLPSGLLIKWMVIDIPLQAVGTLSQSTPLQTWNPAYPVFAGIPAVPTIGTQDLFTAASGAFVGGRSMVDNASITATQYRLRIESYNTNGGGGPILGGWHAFSVLVTAYGQG